MDGLTTRENLCKGIRTSSLEEQKKTVYNMLDKLPTAVWRINKDRELDYISKYWLGFTGRTLEEVKDLWINAIHPLDIEKNWGYLLETFEKREPFQINLRIMLYNEEYRWCMCIGCPCYDEEQNFLGFIGTFYDIDDELKLEDIGKRYKTLYNAITDAIYLYEVVEDADKRYSNFIEVNETTCRRLNYTKEEMLERSIEDICCYDRRTINMLCHKVIEENQLTIEAVHITKDGRHIPVEVNAHCIILEGKQCILSIARDISDRKSSEQLLKESQTKYFNLFINMSDASTFLKVICDDKKVPVDLEYIEVNPAFLELVQLKKEEVVGHTLLELFPNVGKHLIKRLKHNHKMDKHKENIHIKEFYYQPNKKWYSISTYSQTKEYLVAMIKDIDVKKKTELEFKKAIVAAEEANKAKSDFLANISHEIRTPINGILGMLDIALISDMNISQREILTSAKSCAEVLLGIVSDILDFSNIEAGMLNLESIEFNLIELINSSIELYKNKGIEKGIEVICKYTPNIPLIVFGDPIRLQQVINNLLSNAIKFTNNGKVLLQVTQTIETDKEVTVQFSVEDTGIGISNDDKKRLFQSFTQLDSSLTKKHNGTGLGLVICKQLVEMMGGEIWVESIKGKGTTFSFTVIFSKNDIAYRSQNATIIEESFKKILVVDDDYISQRVISTLLEQRGHVVESASNGLEALNLFSSNTYDLVFMDMYMPELDGIATTKRIREIELELGISTPIIAMTAHAIDRSKIIALGLNECISKPVNNNKLFTAMDYVLNDTSHNNKIQTIKELILDHKYQRKECNPSEILVEMEEKISRLSDVIGYRNYLGVEQEAHHIKELAEAIDAKKVMNLAFKIKLAVRRGNIKDMLTLYNKLKQEIENLKSKE